MAPQASPKVSVWGDKRRRLVTVFFGVPMVSVLMAVEEALFFRSLGWLLLPTAAVTLIIPSNVVAYFLRRSLNRMDPDIVEKGPLQYLRNVTTVRGLWKSILVLAGAVVLLFRVFPEGAVLNSLPEQGSLLAAAAILYITSLLMMTLPFSKFPLRGFDFMRMHLALILNFNSNTKANYRKMLVSFNPELGTWKKLKGEYVNRLCDKPEEERRIIALNIQGASKRYDADAVLATLAAQLSVRPEDLVGPIFDFSKIEAMGMRAFSWARIAYSLAEWIMGQLHGAHLHVKSQLGQLRILRR